MLARLRSWLPEAVITAILLLFAVRELGTFPAAWADEGLFIIVAKMLAHGHGYALPMLQDSWYYPYFLNVGPTLIAPSALSIKLFGLSITAARIPMVLYLAAASATFYAFTYSAFGKSHARWATLLLVTLSAYVNTGKPVLGEIPGFFFLILGFWAMQSLFGWKRVTIAGIAFGLAIVTKVTYGLILPSLGLAWLWMLWKKDWPEWKALTGILLLSTAIFFGWRVVEISHSIAGGLGAEFQNQVIGDGQSMLLYVLRKEPTLLLRLPFLAFGAFFLLGAIGWWRKREEIEPSIRIAIPAMIVMFIPFFLSSFGWFRLLLPGHLLLLPFVPAGVFAIFKTRVGSCVLLLLIVAQAWWQWEHKGSSVSIESERATEVIVRDYQDQELIFEQTEVFARLPENPKWFFVMPNLSFSLPEEFSTVSGSLCRIPLVKKLNPTEQKQYKRGQLTPVFARYFIVRDYGCPYTVE